MIKNLRWLALGAALASGCATPASTPASTSLAAEAQAAQPVPLTFAWPAGSEALVEETVQKRGNTAVERYRVRWLPVSDDPTHNDVVMDQLQMTMVNGKPVDAEADRTMLEEVARLSAMLPRMRIDASGALVDVVGVEEMITTVAQSMSDEERANFLELMRSPSGQPILRGAAEKIWNTWVGAVVGLQAPPGEELVAVTTIPGPDGPLEQQTHYLLERAGDRVVISTRTETPAPIARALMQPMLQPLFDRMAQNGVEAAEVFKNIELSISSSTLVEMEPATMRPHRAQARQVFHLSVQGNTQEHVEQHDYVFTWKP